MRVTAATTGVDVAQDDYGTHWDHVASGSAADSVTELGLAVVIMRRSHFADVTVCDARNKRGSLLHTIAHHRNDVASHSLIVEPSTETARFQ